MQKKINIGIIGKKFGYNVIYKSIFNKKLFNVRGFSFRDISKKIALTKNVKIYQNWKKLISDNNINAVIISTPPFTHEKIILYAISKNKHIFCEKPVTTSESALSKICKKLKNKKIMNMVNYEFLNIDAFNFFRNKILKKINIKKVTVNWFIKIPANNRSKWKNKHKQGGGIFFNYIGHSLYYLEKLLGKLIIKKVYSNNKMKIFNLKSNMQVEKKKIDIILNFKSSLISKKIKPKHEIRFETNKGTFVLKTKINNLYDQFYLIKDKKILFKPKKKIEDFRIKPTFINLQKFQKSILNKQNARPNFDDAKRVHFLISKMNKF